MGGDIGRWLLKHIQRDVLGVSKKGGAGFINTLNKMIFLSLSQFENLSHPENELVKSK